MSNCKYVLTKGGESNPDFDPSKIIFDSLDQIRNFLSANGIEDINNIGDRLYAFGRNSRADDVARKLNNDKSYTLGIYKPSILVGEDTSIDSEDVIGVLDYIDLYFPAFISLSKFKPNMDRAAYRRLAREQLIDEGKLTAAGIDIDTYIDNEIASWDITKEDAFLIHRALNSMNDSRYFPKDTAKLGRARNKWKEDLKKYHPELALKLDQGKVMDSYDALYDTMLRINMTIFSAMKKVMELDADGEIKSGRIFYNMTFKAISTDHAAVGKVLAVHCDRMFIDQLGKIHIFNYKVTNEDSARWSPNKKEKYNYEAAFIKAILEYNGFDTNGIEIYNIPVVVKHEKLNDTEFPITSISTNTESDRLVPMTIKRGADNLSKYMGPVKEKIVPPMHKTSILSEQGMENAADFIKVLLPEQNINATALKETASDWIKRHLNTSLIVDTGNGYEVTLGTTKKIYKGAFPTNNAEIIKDVLNYLDLILDELPPTVSAVFDALKNALAKGESALSTRGLDIDIEVVQNTLSKYLLYTLDHDDDTGKDTPVYEWDIIENDRLLSCGVILLKNKYTNLVDIIVPSVFNPDSKVPMPYEHTNNMLGWHTTNGKSPILMEAKYYNLELLRACAVINETLTEQDMDGVRFGLITILNPIKGGTIRVDDMSNAIKEFSKISIFFNDHNLLLHKNNFKHGLVIPIEELLFDLYNSVTSPENTLESLGIKDMVKNIIPIDALRSAQSQEAKTALMLAIMQRVEEQFNGRGEGKHTHAIKMDTLQRKLNSPNPKDKILATIYMQCAKWVNSSHGFYHPEIKYISNFDRAVLPLYANADANVRSMANLYTKALDETASIFQKEYSPIRTQVIEFYKKLGYGSMYTTFIGDPEASFSKMYATDSKTGKKTWLFVDPWDTVDVGRYGLNPDEVKLLKKAIFHINKIRDRAAVQPAFKSDWDENNADFIKYIHTEDRKKKAFLVPLQKGSSAHEKRIPLSDKLKGKKELFDHLKEVGIKLWAKDYLSQGKNVEHTDQSSVEDLALRQQNPYFITDTERDNYIAGHDESYFETNLEYILADFTEKQIVAEQMLKVALYGKAMLFLMYMLGDLEGKHSQNCLKRSIEELEKYMRLNIFGKDILDDFERLALDLMSGPKKLMTRLFIAGNIRGAVRDSFEGIWQNFARTICKYQTDLNYDSVLKGYKTVILDVFKSSTSLDIVSELCLRYRLSNTDAAKIAERAKIGRGGIMNPDTIAFSTLRGPDFLNRMTLFVARCMLDGVWQAFSMQDGLLMYNWKKDKRFSVYADKSKKGTEEYKKLQAAYYAAITLWNKEHPDKLLDFDDPKGLPEPYSQLEIRKFKMFSDGIYGAYDKSLKAMYENTALGQAMGIFSTWFNGHTAAWLRKPGYYDEYFTSKDSKDHIIIKRDPISGNELYYNVNDHGNIVEKIGDKYIDSDTGEEVLGDEFVPVIDNVPVYALGIAYTLGDILSVFKKKGFDYKAFKELIFDNPYEMDNLKKAGMDLLMFLLLGGLFALLFTPAYDAYKKEQTGNMLADSLVSLLYNGANSSYDGFTGIWAIGNYICNDASPGAANTSIKVISDLGKTVAGKKTWTNLMFTDLPMVRLFKEPFKLNHPDLFKVNTES